jgi:hypothetical protein
MLAKSASGLGFAFADEMSWTALLGNRTRSEEMAPWHRLCALAAQKGSSSAMRHLPWFVRAHLVIVGLAACTRVKSDTQIDDGTHQEAGPEPALDGGDARPGDADADAGCAARCDQAGKFRCAEAETIQVCVERRGCLEWMDAGRCGDGLLCCDGVCVAADTANCYGCGMQCIGPTPSCSQALRHCACGPASCAADSQCDSKTGACVPLSPPPHADYYVDAHAPTGGDGSVNNPFTTITSALARTSADQAASPGKALTIYAAAGTYDEALGETFPLTLRGSISLLGAGSEKTVIVGSGDFDHSAAGGAFNETYHLTILAGDTTGAITISGLTLLPSVPSAAPQYFGVFCDRGNAASASDGLTTLDGVTLGPGYHQAVMATTSTSPSSTGCNLRMVSSKITGVWVGIYGQGCELGTGQAPVALDVGSDDPEKGNSFSWIRTVTNDGYGVLAQACVAKGVFRNNEFVDSARGIQIDQREHGTAINSFTIRGNRFERLSVTGLWIYGYPPVVQEISDNTFQTIQRTLANDRQFRAIGLTISSGPRALKVRRNKFIGNDIGVLLVSNSINYSSSQPPSDFGTDAEPGENVFRCNSTSVLGGADVRVELPGSGIVPFVGNQWDHVPPTALGGGLQSDGVDILYFVSGATLDARAASSATSIACPLGRTAGP